MREGMVPIPVRQQNAWRLREAGVTVVVGTDAGAVLAWDDDRGKGLNARIVRKLYPGTYWLSVRHKTPAATGQYTIGVKTASS